MDIRGAVSQEMPFNAAGKTNKAVLRGETRFFVHPQPVLSGKFFNEKHPGD